MCVKCGSQMQSPDLCTTTASSRNVAWARMRDLAQVLAHVHDAENEIDEGPEPRPRMKG